MASKYCVELFLPTEGVSLFHADLYVGAIDIVITVSIPMVGAPSAIDLSET